MAKEQEISLRETSAVLRSLARTLKVVEKGAAAAEAVDGLESYKKQLEGDIKKLEAEKTSVADVSIKAQNDAAALVFDAQTKADAILAKAESEASSLKDKAAAAYDAKVRASEEKLAALGANTVEAQGVLTAIKAEIAEANSQLKKAEDAKAKLAKIVNA